MFPRCASQLLLTGLLALLALVGCGGGSKSAAPTTQPGLPAISRGESLSHRLPSNEAALGVYSLSLDFSAGVAAVLPIQPPRDATAIGDTVTPDITPYLNQSPCADCFKVKAMAKDPDGNLLIDFGLRHPFSSTALRSDLSVFDARAILIVAGTTQFPASPKINTNNDGVPDLPASGNFALLANADGYTSHFDEKVTDTNYFNPPLLIPGSVNPYINFFTEANPSPTVNGFPIANHRFGQTPVMDVKRFKFALPPDGTTQLRLIVVIEARYGVSATYAKTQQDPSQPGSRQNPVYFLPSFNQAEAYRTDVNVQGDFTEGDPADKVVPVEVAVEDWQAGLLGNPNYGALDHPEYIPATSDVTKVTLELPALQAGIKARTSPVSGTGNFGDPYVFDFQVKNELTASAGTYVGLVSVVDSLDGQAESPTAAPGKSIYSFNAYKPFTITVHPAGGTNNPPVAVPEPTPNPVDSGVQVDLTDSNSYDPDAGDSITKYEWDFDVSDGRTYTDSVSASPNQASTIYTNSGSSPITKTASLRVTDTHTATGVMDVDITVNPTAANNNPPNAVADANPNPVNSGATISLIDDASTDPDAGDSITKYEWDFDVSNGRTYTDAVNTTQDQASTSYTNSTASPITVTASVRVTDSHGATDADDVVIVVQPASAPNNPPVAVADANPLVVDSGKPVSLIDHDSHDDDAGDSITEYAWDFDISNGATYTDAVNATADQASTSYTNSTSSPITVIASLRVKDTHGATDTDDVVITVNPVTPTCNNTPLAAPANFRVPTLPDPPYNTNFISFSWDPISDPCLLGYAVYRSDRYSSDNSFKLLNDPNHNGILERNEVLTTPAFADNTLGASNATTNQYYWYVVRSVKDTTPLVVSANSRTAFVYFNDFEDDTLGLDTFFANRDGEVFGRTNTQSYPSYPGNDYGWGIARTGSTSGAPHNGTRFLDESAYLWAPYGATNNAPYANGRHDDRYPIADGWQQGYWNTIGPTLATGYEDSGIPAGATVVQMQLFQRYQIQTSGGNAEDLAYCAVFGENDSNNTLYKNYVSLPVLSGKGYDGVNPGIPAFLDQQNLAPSSQDPNQQIPAMPFFAGDYQTPSAGAPNWIKTVFDLTPAKSISRPVIQFCFAADETAQGTAMQHPGWSIDDMLIVAY